MRVQLFLPLFLCFSACSKDDVASVACDGSNLTYNSGVSSIINSNCNASGCHNSGSSNGSFTSFSGLQGVIGNGTFNSRVLSKQDMPQGSATLSQSQLNSLKCWVDNGFPEN
jgi:hypothetical protein